MSQNNKDNIKYRRVGVENAHQPLSTHEGSTARRVELFFEEINLLRLVTGVTLCVMSLMILVMSMFGFIRSFLLAAFVSMFASVSCMLSLFFLYDLFKRRASKQNLVRESINNAVKNRN